MPITATDPCCTAATRSRSRNPPRRCRRGSGATRASRAWSPRIRRSAGTSPFAGRRTTPCTTPEASPWSPPVSGTRRSDTNARSCGTGWRPPPAPRNGCRTRRAPAAGMRGRRASSACRAGTGTARISAMRRAPPSAGESRGALGFRQRADRRAHPVEVVDAEFVDDDQDVDVAVRPGLAAQSAALQPDAQQAVAELFFQRLRCPGHQVSMSIMMVLSSCRFGHRDAGGMRGESGVGRSAARRHRLVMMHPDILRPVACRVGACRPRTHRCAGAASTSGGVTDPAVRTKGERHHCTGFPARPARACRSRAVGSATA